MRNLPIPSRDNARADLEKALKKYQARKQTVGYDATAAEIDAIIALYDNYDEGLGMPSDVFVGGGLAEELSQALHDSYDRTQKNGKLKAIRTLVFSDIDLCPICGIDPVNELDHHLPRSEFKPLAIYARNLVPMCHGCNHIKLAGFGDNAEPDKEYVHAYFDELPDVQFVCAEIEVQGDALKVTFKIDSDAVPVSLGNRLSNQMTELKLNDRYQGEVNTYMNGHAVSLHTNWQGRGEVGVRAFLRAQARYEIGEYHKNHWRPVLLNALAGHAGFCAGEFANVLPVPAEILEDFANPDAD